MNKQRSFVLFFKGNKIFELINSKRESLVCLTISVYVRNVLLHFVLERHNHNVAREGEPAVFFQRERMYLFLIKTTGFSSGGGIHL